MDSINITLEEFLRDRQGRTFADVANSQPFEEVIQFFSDADRQRRMEEAEIHHDRAPLSGVVRELESLTSINQFLGSVQAQKNQRLRQAIGVLIRMIMERRGWKKTGKKGSLGVRSSRSAELPAHNNGGLAFWFLRAERYENQERNKFLSVRERYQVLEANISRRERARRTAKHLLASERRSKGPAKHSPSEPRSPKKDRRQRDG
jgi:hypothetical protein